MPRAELSAAVSVLEAMQSQAVQQWIDARYVVDGLGPAIRAAAGLFPLEHLQNGDDGDLWVRAYSSLVSRVRAGRHYCARWIKAHAPEMHILIGRTPFVHI